MSLPEKCWKCGEAEWEGRQEVTPPTEFERPYWHRRTWCLFCNAAQDEIAGGGLVAITRRDQPIRWWGRNPYLTAERSEAAS